MLKKFIPTYVYKSVYDIDFKMLYDKGIRLILTDLDNTLISYKDTLPTERLFEFKKMIEGMGFEFILVSNSRKGRVDTFSKAYNIRCQKFSTKPLKRGIKKAIKMANKKYNKDEILLMGDQIMTDVLGANRCGINSCLIFPVDKSTEHKGTRFNRFFEQFFLNRLRKSKKYKSVYEEKLKEFDLYE